MKKSIRSKSTVMNVIQKLLIVNKGFGLGFNSRNLLRYSSSDSPTFLLLGFKS
ncbi:hypothetical protein [Francisella noatunensis]|uniref:Uncharacterized protein n=1 Tax=Francisella noatunensis TaxID=657445 RepID=A0A9Q2KQN7_9GAMM|nr:hypothetical protein [Francisella noatunensis]MBK2050136.1 hypothetical protein [Francisella noatunensis]MBK2054526.1 hypothetical protein [Francisella noatunensis]MBK2064907.1 hypothetical protein [Francisella noatunensis]MBK2068859.1 hypothetical protein [Francisella noatunensis]